MISTVASLPAFALPLAVAIACMLLLPAPLHAPARLQAAGTLLGSLLLTGFLTLIVLHHPNTPLTGAELLFASLAMLAAALVVAPLLDRARAPGLLVAGSVAGIGLVYYTLQSLAFELPEMNHTSLLYTVIIAATLVGIAGGMQLPLHPSRVLATGQLRWSQATPGLMLSGWCVMALMLAGFSWLVAPKPAVDALPVLGSAMIAAFVSLLSARAEDALQKAGEGLAAGVLIALMAPLSLEAGGVLGVLAGFFVTRSESITSALRLDDPHHMVGALLLPAMAGLLMPGLLYWNLLAPHLTWLAAALTMGAVAAALLWPLIMLTLGLALPPRLVREGATQR